MSNNKFINNSYCVGGKHYSPTTNIYGDATNTGISMGRPVKILRGNCMICSRNKGLIVCDRTTNAKDWATSLNIWVLQPKTLERKYSITQAVH